MHPLFEQASGLTETIIGGAIEVHRDKGPGLIESLFLCVLRVLLFNPLSAIACPHQHNIHRKMKTESLVQRSRGAELGLGMALAFVCFVVTAAESAKETRELLARHETLARLENIKFERCRGLTALCPDRCGQSGEFAHFRIVKYLKYEKTGEYGDPKRETFRVQISDFHRQPKGDPGRRETIIKLKEGDYVRLNWRHEYVRKEGASFPERPVTQLKRVDPKQAERMLREKTPNP